MRIISAIKLQNRIMEVARKMDCDNISQAKKGKSSADINDSILEMMFIHEFLPY